jgi:LysR family hydrogen peroxide-inducible transcriptional activator
MITVIQLEYLIAIDTYKNYAKAAEHCNVTQPTLSMQVKKLEEELGVTIFDRSRQPVTTTDVGKVIIEQARISLREVQKIPLVVNQYGKNVSGRLQVGIIPTISSYLLPMFIGDFSIKHPQIQLSITEAYTHDILRMLQNDQLDVAIVATPVNDFKVMEEPIYYEEIKVYMSYGHPLMNKELLVAEDVQRSDIWMLTQGNCFRNQVMNICNGNNSKLADKQITYESTSLETLKKLVDSEGGFMMMPELAVLELNARQLKQVKSFAPPVPLREVGLIYVRSVSKISLIEILKQSIIDALPPEMCRKDRGLKVEWQ